MSLLLRRAKRECRQQHRNLIKSPKHERADSVARTLLAEGSPVKPSMAGLAKWYPWAKKSQNVVEEPSIDSWEVTAAFLVHQLGMVAAEIKAVDVNASPNFEETCTGQDSKGPVFLQGDEDTPGRQGLEDPVASDAADLLESLRFLFLEPSEIEAGSPQERTRDSMDSDSSTRNTRDGSSVGDVDTGASTPQSTSRESQAMYKTPDDVPVSRVYRGRRNRPMISDLDIPLVREHDQESEKQSSADSLKENHASETVPAHEMAHTTILVPDPERDVSPPPTNAAQIVAATATSKAESTRVGINLHTNEIGALAGRQASKRRAGNTERRRRKATKSGNKGHNNALCNLQKIITRGVHTHASDKQKSQQEIAKLEEANESLEQRNTFLKDTNFEWYKAHAILNDRMLELEDQNLNEDPRTIAGLNKDVKMLKEKITQLEESKMQAVTAATRELSDYKQGQKGKVETLQAKLERTQEELAYAVEARDAFEEQLSDALALQNSTDQEAVAAFEAKEKTLKQENENRARLLQEESKKRKESEQLATDLRLSVRKAERNLKEAQDQITHLASANKLLEARAEPIDFLGLPPHQRNEMARMQHVVDDVTEELRLAKELLDKVSRAKLGQVQSIVLEDRDQHYQMYIARIEAQNEQITELKKGLSILEHAMRCDQGLAVGVQEENEELKISLNAVTNDLKAFREKQANGDYSLVDPRSWLHMQQCSEGREQAILRQQKAEENCRQVQGQFEAYKVKAMTVAASLWFRIWAFEGLIHPAQCPYYLTDNRDELVNSTGDVFELDINWKSLDDEAKSEAEDLRYYGHYRGPKGTPEAWLPVAVAQSQASGSNYALASITSSVSGSVLRASVTSSAVGSDDAQGSFYSSIAGSVVGIDTPAEAITALDTSTSQHAAGHESETPIDIQTFIKAQHHLIRRLQVHVAFLWGRIWEFEAIVTPEECDPRVWNKRKALVRRSFKYANFNPNYVDLDLEVGVPESNGPLHTPDAWIPETDDLDGEDENDSIDGFDDDDDGGNDDGDHDGGHNVIPNGASVLDAPPDGLQQPSTGPSTQDQTTTNITNYSPTISTSDPLPPTVPSSSTATLAELDARALLLTSDPTILSDHILAQHLAAHPHLIFPELSNRFEEQEPALALAGAKQPWVSRQLYTELDSSTMKNKGLDRDLYREQEQNEEVGEEPYVPNFGLSQQQLDSAIADCQRRMNQSVGYEGVSQQTRKDSGDFDKALEDGDDRDRKLGG
ncbi:hypothetical protein G7Y79_00021g050760 [Physcia stellaris]|nr:hypothetical protein G7Y79_00021g050760 [Physcia stellaris]